MSNEEQLQSELRQAFGATSPELLPAWLKSVDSDLNPGPENCYLTYADLAAMSQVSRDYRKIVDSFADDDKSPDDFHGHIT